MRFPLLLILSVEERCALLGQCLLVFVEMVPAEEQHAE
jgi:hypothetical protein